MERPQPRDLVIELSTPNMLVLTWGKEAMKGFLLEHLSIEEFGKFVMARQNPQQATLTVFPTFDRKEVKQFIENSVEGEEWEMYQKNYNSKS